MLNTHNIWYWKYIEIIVLLRIYRNYYMNIYPIKKYWKFQMKLLNFQEL